MNKVRKLLDDWNVRERYDALDGSKHMGLILLTRNRMLINNTIKEQICHTISRNKQIQIQLLTITLENGLRNAFIYCRSSPTYQEIRKIKNLCHDCDFTLGDLNLSHRNTEDRKKINDLCDEDKISFLNEVTRLRSNNQLDYVFVHKKYLNNCFTTSYHNFISDHNSIVLRIGLENNILLDSIKEKITFNEDFHLKRNVKNLCSSSNDSESESCIDSDIGEEKIVQDNKMTPIFKRNFANEDNVSCWINASLQMILAGLDYHDSRQCLSSELGAEIFSLGMMDSFESLSSLNVKRILVSSEDTRIALEISKLEAEENDLSVIEKRRQNLLSLRQDLATEEQCIRDFLVCITENVDSWPDVFKFFAFDISHSTSCCRCNSTFATETTQLFF